jgi:hypothetical protein
VKSFACNPACRWHTVSQLISGHQVEAAMKKIREGNKSGGMVMSGLTKRGVGEAMLRVAGRCDFHGRAIPTH